MKPVNTVKRPIMRYHGGKWRLSTWIIEHFPPHRVYTEPYGGAASVLLRKPRSYSEVYNDLNGEIVNLFRVLRNPSQSRELIRQVKLTPYSRQEYETSYILADDPIEQARRTLLKHAAGFASGAQRKYGTGFRANVTRANTTPADNWRDMPSAIEPIVDRLRGVIIEHDNALTVLDRYDTPDTLHYVDPPYVFETRNPRNAGETYAHEMDDDNHRLMAETLYQLRGGVILSGYQSPLYNDLFNDWLTVTRNATADGGKKRIEVLWINKRAQNMGSFPLFDSQKSGGTHGK